MSLRFAVVRPYADRFRKHVFSFLKAQGFDVVAPPTLPSEATNDETLAWLVALQPVPDLILMPFHLHRDRLGQPVSGFDIAEKLPVGWATPILCPLSDFAFASSFPRRMRVLRARRPDVADWLLPMPVGSIGSADVERNLAELVNRARS